MTDSYAATSAAQAVFYNMTGEDLTMEVNQQVGTAEKVPAIPTTSPYTPNHNANTYTRVNLSEPQINQFGNTNELFYSSQDGTSIKINLTIDVDCNDYPVTNPLLIFMFRDAVVVTCPTDSVPYVGHDGEKIVVAHGSSTTL
ncbi:MAG: hypothetical protein HOY78_10780 [Saccharothrix sp.]|nr:hypothetical protein [Saccharothrix sp.]